MSAMLNFLHLHEVTRRRELALLIGLGVMEGFSWTLIKPMLPLFASSLGAQEMLVGAIVAVPPLVQIFTRIPSGAAATRYGKRRMILLSFVMTMAGAAILTVTKSVALIFPAQLFVALGESFFWPASWSYVTSLAPRPKQGTVVALVMGIQGIAGLFMPYVGGRIFDLWGFWVNGMIYLVCAAIGVVLAVRLPLTESPPELDLETAQPAVAAVAPEAPPAAPRAAPRQPFAAGARALLAREPIMLAAWSGLIIFFSWGVNGAFYAIYVKEHLGFTATTVGMLGTLSGGFMAASRFIFAGVAQRVRTDRAMLLGIFVNAFPLMLLPWIRTLPMLCVVAAVTGLASGIPPIAMKTLYANSTNDQERSLAMGIDGVAMNIGALASPLLAGVSAQAVGIPATFFFGHLLTLVALAAARRVTRNRGFVRALSGREPEVDAEEPYGPVSGPVSEPVSGPASGPAAGAVAGPASVQAKAAERAAAGNTGL